MNIAIIPARGGSKRIPRKNIKDFLGKPIISYAIDAALTSKIFDTVMVSTDDEDIAEVSKKYGAEVPFIRRGDLSSDTAMTVPVLIDAVDYYKKNGKDFIYGCCIYPCSPLITPKLIKQGMEMLIGSEAGSVVPMVKFSYPPQRGFAIKNGKAAMMFPENYAARTQDLEPVYHDAGQFYCFRTNSMITENTVFCADTIPLVLDETCVQDIDTEEDWKIAEMKYKLFRNI